MCMRPYDPATARALLDKFGYKDRDGDGFRELPDGKPFTLMMGSQPTGRERERDELWKKSLDGIGIRVDFVKRNGRICSRWRARGSFSSGRSAGSPRLATATRSCSFSTGRTRHSRISVVFATRSTMTSTAESKRVPPGREREELYAKMDRIAAVYNPMDLGVYRVENTLTRPWLLGYRKHIYFEHAWKYYDLDLARRK